MTAPATSPALVLPVLPTDLQWCEDFIRAKARHGAFFSSGGPLDVAALGGTTRSGMDIPADASWAEWARFSFRELTTSSHQDCEVLWLQLNLADIPAEARPANIPPHGVVWVFIDLSDDWKGRALFDPRPAESIPWIRLTPKPQGVAWSVRPTLPDITPETFPEFYWFEELHDPYNHWAQDLNRGVGIRRTGQGQVGGCIWPIQGQADDSVVMEMPSDSIGDAGAVYLIYKDGAWSVNIHTH